VVESNSLAWNYIWHRGFDHVDGCCSIRRIASIRPVGPRADVRSKLRLKCLAFFELSDRGGVLNHEYSIRDWTGQGNLLEREPYREGLIGGMDQALKSHLVGLLFLLEPGTLCHVVIVVRVLA